MKEKVLNKKMVGTRIQRIMKKMRDTFILSDYDFNEIENIIEVEFYKYFIDNQTKEGN